MYNLAKIVKISYIVMIYVKCFIIYTFLTHC
jgi:hypothetical protein